MKQNKIVSSEKTAVVLLSGGLDSSTVLYHAIANNFNVVALSFRYNQRHSIELDAAAAVAKHANVKHYVLDVDLSLFGASALTADIDVPKGGVDLDKEDFIPVTYVPARNLVFLSLAAALAESLDCKDIFIGVNALDYSGYPDCRPDFIESFTQTVNLATRIGRMSKEGEEQGFKVHTPLLHLSKAQIVKEAVKLKVPLEHTWSCYAPIIENGKARPCGECDSCILRKRGFAEAGEVDVALSE